MTATVAPLELSDERGDPLRLLPIAVNLLPSEIVSARISRSARRATVVVLLTAVVATGGWYYHTSQQTSAASTELAQAQDQAAAVARSQRDFADLKATKSKTKALQTRLIQVTAGDIAWSRLIPAIRKVAPRGVALTGVSGTATASTQTPGAVATPGTSAASGSLILTGQAPNKVAISTFVNHLGTVPGLSGPLVTNVAVDSQTHKPTFSIQVTTTPQALSTRYTAKGVK